MEKNLTPSIHKDLNDIIYVIHVPQRT